MPLRDRLLYHQIHPFKITVDVLSTLIGIYFYWQHELLLGLALTFIPPIIASAIILYSADLRKISRSRLGGYVQANMTRTLEILRFLTNFVMLSGAWYRLWWLVALGAFILIACWCWGLVLDWL